MDRRGYDYTLVLLTVAALLALGIICLYGTGHYHFASTENAQWVSGPEHASYLELMNRIAFPALALLLIALGLCIPKRVVPRNFLNRISAVILGVTLFVYAASGIAWALGFIFATAIAIQAASLFLTLIKRGRLVYEKEGHLVQLGSALLHLGIIILIFDIALLKGHNLHISIFWVSTAMLLAGMLLSFYARKIPVRGFSG